MAVGELNNLVTDNPFVMLDGEIITAVEQKLIKDARSNPDFYKRISGSFLDDLELTPGEMELIRKARAPKPKRNWLSRLLK